MPSAMQIAASTSDDGSECPRSIADRCAMETPATRATSLSVRPCSARKERKQWPMMRRRSISPSSHPGQVDTVAHKVAVGDPPMGVILVVVQFRPALKIVASSAHPPRKGDKSVIRVRWPGEDRNP